MAKSLETIFALIRYFRSRGMNFIADKLLAIVKSKTSTKEAVIKKRKNKWCVLSEDESRSFGCYTKKDDAEERLRQVEYFKHNGNGHMKDKNTGEAMVNKKDRLFVLSYPQVILNSFLSRESIGSLLKEARKQRIDTKEVAGDYVFTSTSEKKIDRFRKYLNSLID